MKLGSSYKIVKKGGNRYGARGNPSLTPAEVSQVRVGVGPEAREITKGMSQPEV